MKSRAAKYFDGLFTRYYGVMPPGSWLREDHVERQERRVRQWEWEHEPKVVRCPYCGDWMPVRIIECATCTQSKLALEAEDSG